MTEAKHPIQVVARRTGLNPDVIRAWERRYQTVVPQRASNGRRLYADTDVEKLTLLRRATSAGRRISDIADLSVDALYSLIETDEVAAAQARVIPSERPNTGSVMEHFEECLDAITGMNSSHLKACLIKADKALGVPFLLEDLIRPLISHVRDECRRGNLRQCHERVATATVRSYMYNLASSENSSDARHNLIVSTPVGQRYDLIALRMAVAANFYGWNAIYLGTELSAEEIAYACDQTQSYTVALGIASPSDDPHLANTLRELKRKIGVRTSLIVGGKAVTGYTEVIQEINAVIVQTMGDLRMELDRLRRPMTARIDTPRI